MSSQHQALHTALNCHLSLYKHTYRDESKDVKHATSRRGKGPQRLSSPSFLQKSKRQQCGTQSRRLYMRLCSTKAWWQQALNLWLGLYSEVRLSPQEFIIFTGPLHCVPPRHAPLVGWFNAILSVINNWSAWPQTRRIYYPLVFFPLSSLLEGYSIM